jgi:hypothetical protein
MDKTKTENSRTRFSFALEPVYIISFLTLIVYASAYAAFTTFSNTLFVSNSMIELPFYFYLYGPVELLGHMFFIIPFVFIIYLLIIFVEDLINKYLPKLISNINILSYILYTRILFIILGLIIAILIPINIPIKGSAIGLNLNLSIGLIFIFINLWAILEDNTENIREVIDAFPLYIKYASIFILLIIILIVVFKYSTTVGEYYADDLLNRPADLTIYIKDGQNVAETKYKLVMHYDNNYYLLNNSNAFKSIYIIPDGEVKMAIINKHP